MLTRSQKMYLYSIYMLGQNGNAVRSADVARLVGVSKPSTVKMVQKLVDEQYIIKEPYKEITLTEKGITAANKLYTPSIILRDFLINTVGVSQEHADNDAVIMVSQMTDETLEKLVRFTLDR